MSLDFLQGKKLAIDRIIGCAFYANDMRIFTAMEEI